MNENLENLADPVLVEAGSIVATVRLRERRGSAIGVCEQPRVLELGKTASEVLGELRRRIGNMIAPQHGVTQLLLVIRDDGESVSTEPLR